MRKAMTSALLVHFLPLLTTFAGTVLTCDIELAELSGTNVALPTIHASGLNKAVDEDTREMVNHQIIVGTLQIKSENGAKLAEDAAQTGHGQLQTYARTTCPRTNTMFLI